MFMIMDLELKDWHFIDDEQANKLNNVTRDKRK